MCHTMIFILTLSSLNDGTVDWKDIHCLQEHVNIISGVTILLQLILFFLTTASNEFLNVISEVSCNDGVCMDKEFLTSL